MEVFYFILNFNNNRNFYISIMEVFYFILNFKNNNRNFYNL